jgi:large subunit ribosomal protein L25
MDQVTLRTEPRTERGTRPAKRLRRGGQVPAVVYGRGIDPLTVSVSARELYSALTTDSGLNALISLEADGDDPILTVAREIQRDPVRGDITHVDLVKVSLDVAIQADVSIEFVGTPTGVLEGGGFVETIETSVLVEALPTEIPTSIPVEIADLQIGDTLHVSDLPPFEGVTYLDDIERPLLTVIIPRVVEEEVEEELLEGEELEGEEDGEEGEGAAEEGDGDEADQA